MKILKDSALYLLAEILSKMVSFILLPYVSRKMGAASYGELSYFTMYSSIFTLILLLSQDGAVSRYFYFYGKRGLNLITLSGYIYTISLGTIMLFICWIFQSEIMAYLVISSVFSVFIAVQLSIKQCQKQPIPYISIQLFSLFISVSATIISLELYDSELAEKRIIATLISNIIVTFFIFLFVKKDKFHTRKFSFKKYKLGIYYIFGFGLPLLLHHFSHFLRGQIDRLFIYHKFGDAELGLYAMGANIASILTVLIFAVNKATLPYYFEALKNKTLNLKKIYKITLFSFFIVPIPAILMIFIPNEMIIWVLSEQFDGVKYFISIFLLSNALSIPYLFLVNYLFFYGKNKVIATCSIISATVYFIALSIASFWDIKYIPLASIFAAIIIIIVLFFETYKLSKIVEAYKK